LLAPGYGDALSTLIVRFVTCTLIAAAIYRGRQSREDRCATLKHSRAAATTLYYAHACKNRVALEEKRVKCLFWGCLGIYDTLSLSVRSATL
jgi:hypothetical protein